MSQPTKKSLHDLVSGLRGLFDELRLRMHLGTMEVKDAWRVFETELAGMEAHLAAKGKEAVKEVSARLERLAAAARQVQDKLAGHDHPSPPANP